MRPLSLRLKNIYSHEDSYLNLRHRSLALIVGEIDGRKGDSNGAGKSSVFDGMEFALFGLTRGPSARIIRDGCDSAEVSFIFRGDDGNCYKVKRSIKVASNGTTSQSVSFFFQQNGGWCRKENELEKSKGGIQQEINKAIGMDAEVFRQSVYLRQAGDGGFANLSRATRRELVKKFMHRGRWDALAKVSGDELKRLKKEHDSGKSIVEDLEARIEDVSKIDESITERSALLATALESKKEKEKELAVLAERVANVNEFEKTSSFIKAKLQSKKSDVASCSSLIDESSKLNEQEKLNFNKERSAFKEREAKAPELQESIEKLDAELVNLKLKQLSLTEVRAESRVFQEELVEHEKNLAGIKANMAVLKESKEKIVALDGCCPTCTSYIDEKTKEILISGLRENHERLRKSAEAPSRRISELKEILKNIGLKESSLTAEVADLPKKQVSRDKCQEALDKISADRESLRSLHEKVKRSVAAREEKLKEMTSRLSDLKLELAVIEKEWNQLASDATNSAEIKHDHEVLVKAVSSFEASGLRYREEIAALKERRLASVKLQDSVSSKKKELDAILVDIADYTVLTKALGKEGIQAIILENSIAELELQARAFLKRFTSDRFDVRIKTVSENVSNDNIQETFDIFVDKGNGVWHPYESFSGGEKMKIDFAFRLALALLAASHSLVKPDYLYIDEVVGCLDSYGRRAFMEILAEITKDFSLILVVTHFPEMQEDFKDVITVKRSDLVSRIVDSAQPEAEDLFGEEGKSIKPKKASSKAKSKAVSDEEILVVSNDF